MQQKYKFDKVTLIKIGKGALIAVTGTLGLFILKWVGAIDFGSTLTPFIGALIPIVTNIIREWIKGAEEPDIQTE